MTITEAERRASTTVVVAGQGYVGLPIAMRAVEAGYDVIGYEPDPIRAKRLIDADSYVEDVPNDVLAAAVATGRYRTTDVPEGCRGFDVAIITVPTPLKDGAPDLSYIERCAEELAPLVRPGAAVILESTTYPGTTEELLVPTLERGSGLTAGEDFHVGYSPERIDPGNQTWTFATTPKVVSGIDDASADAVTAFYRTLVDFVVPVTNTKVAELTKLLENTFRHVNIALMNELAMFAGELGVDVWEAIEAASTKPFGFMKFTPGPGVGGHCLPVDPSYLSWRVKQTLGSSFRFVELANDINDGMPHYVVQRAILNLNRRAKAINGSEILILGFSYKRNSADLRVSPGPRIYDDLQALGARVSFYDPVIGNMRSTEYRQTHNLNIENLDRTDLIILVTDHDAIDYAQLQSCSSSVLDTRRRLAPKENVEYL